VTFVETCLARDSDISIGYVKPSVLQGQYNLLARRSEADLLPVLRKHGIAYYAYS
jgi:aflatoxin B1 aldehyde reductase